MANLLAKEEVNPMRERHFRVVKESGEKQRFSKRKFLQSMFKAGLDKKAAQEVLKKLLPEFKEGISTKKIYQKARSHIQKQSRKAASVYSLRRSLLLLGPDGFSFEKYMGEVFKLYGYEVDISRKLKGHCVNHEVDIVAFKEGKTLFVECKFHNRLGRKEDVKTPLYVDSRRRDLEKTYDYNEFWLVTNTEFTADALQYGECSGLVLKALGGNGSNNLFDFITEVQGLPVSCLNTLRKKDIPLLLENDYFLVKDVLNRPHILDDLGYPYIKKRAILGEAAILCSSGDE